MRTLLIHRDYEHWTGGHGKFLDYIAHVQAHPDWQVVLHLSPRSRCLPDNPFRGVAPVRDAWEPQAADALLLGGLDWRQLDGITLPPGLPVVSLVQGVCHAEPGSALRGFLSRRALRICVSHAVAEAVAASGEVNGPLQVVPAAVDVAALARLGLGSAPRGTFVDAVKQPALGREVGARLAASGAQVDVLTQRVPRHAYLTRMARAAVVVTLPDVVEGFYLPGLEAMAMGRALVQYDCVGCGEYLRAGVNALVTPCSPEAIAASANRLQADAALRTRLVAAAQATAQDFDLPAERRRVHALLDSMDEVWRAC